MYLFVLVIVTFTFDFNFRGVRNGSGEEGRRYEMPKKYGDLKNYHQPLW
jgi:hypothetical protein